MTKRFLTLIAALIIATAQPGFVNAAVTRDTVTSGQKGASGATLTVSHTVTTSGSNRAIFVLCALDSRTVTITAAYAGEAMTLVRSQVHASIGISTWIFKKVAPATGANNWVVTQSVAENMICYAFSATDVDQTTTTTDDDGICGSSVQATSTLTLTTASDEILLDILGTAADTSALTEGANQTEEMELAEGTAMDAAGSRQAGSDGGAMNYTWTTTSSYCYSAIAIKAAAAIKKTLPIVIFVE